MSFQLSNDIIAYREIVELIPEAVRAYRIGNNLLSSKASARIFELIGSCTELEKETVTELNGLLEPLMAALETEDDVLIADYLESGLQPLFSELLAGIVSDAVASGAASESIELSKDVQVELTVSGRYTLKVRGFYFHSNSSPIDEARLLAASKYKPEEEVSLIFGLGLGYHVLEALKCDLYRKVYVFEPDSEIIKAYEYYGMKPEIDEFERAEIFYDPEGKKLSEFIKQYPEVTLQIHYPTLKAMPAGKLKDSLLRFYAPVQSINNQLDVYRMSFRENTRLAYKHISEFHFRPEGKRAFIISAGPSLDDNYMAFVNRTAEDVLLATAPTLRKLYAAGIIPDCTVISDSKPELKKLHKGAEDADCPLIFSSTASVPFVREHKGPRYMLCQKGFEPAEQLAEKMGWPLFSSAGSVAVVTLNLAIDAGFKEIVFVGQDLCYHGDKMHAADTSPQFKTGEAGKRKITKDILGREVTVPLNFEIFKKEIEGLIAAHPEIKFYNATEGGLHIEGSTDVKLSEIL